MFHLRVNVETRKEETTIDGKGYVRKVGTTPIHPATPIQVLKVDLGIACNAGVTD